jgi:DNA-binding Xre family transcriptional regulator
MMTLLNIIDTTGERDIISEIIDNLKNEKMATKLEGILERRSLTQGDLMRLIYIKTGFMMGRDRISKICTGRLKNYTIETAVMISEALEIKVDDIIELHDIKKTNMIPQ